MELEEKILALFERIWSHLKKKRKHIAVLILAIFLMPLTTSFFTMSIEVANSLSKTNDEQNQMIILTFIIAFATAGLLFFELSNKLKNEGPIMYFAYLAKAFGYWFVCLTLLFISLTLGKHFMDAIPKSDITMGLPTLKSLSSTEIMIGLNKFFGYLNAFAIFGSLALTAFIAAILTSANFIKAVVQIIMEGK